MFYYFFIFYCTDVNECQSNNGNCQHTCQNTVGSFSCGCNSGFILASNGQTCNGECEIFNLDIFCIYHTTTCVVVVVVCLFLQILMSVPIAMVAVPTFAPILQGPLNVVVAQAFSSPLTREDVLVSAF